jgi:hypothetical protein
METKYFENHLRGYKVVLAILRAESEDDSCINCIGLEGAIIKVGKGLKKMKLDLTDSTASEQDRENITSQIDQLSQQVERVPLGEAPT